MNNRVLCFIVLVSLLATLAFADTNLARSKTNEATASLFTEEQDMYLDVIDFAKLSKNHLFLNMGSPSGPANAPFEIGAASKLGGLYLGTKLRIASVGNDGGQTNFGITQGSNITYLYDNAFGIVGSVKETTEKLYHETNNEYSAAALLGIGKMGLLIYGGQDDASKAITGDAAIPVFTGGAGYNPVNFAAAAVGNAQTSSVKISYDQAGTAVSKNVTEYDEGYDNNNTINFGLQFGLSLDLAGLASQVRAGVGASLVNMDGEYGDTAYRSSIGSEDFTRYEGIDSAVYYKNETQAKLSQVLNLNPSAFFGMEMPAGLMGGTTLSFGIGVGMNMPIYLVTEERTYSSKEYIPTLGAILGYTETVQEGTETTERQSMTTTMTPQVGLKKQFSDLVTLSIQYIPTVQYRSSKIEYSGEQTRTTTTLADSGVAQNNSVVVETVTEHGRIYSNERLSLGNEIRAGLQFMLKDKLRINVGALTTTGIQEISQIEKREQDGLVTYNRVKYYGVTDTDDADPITESYSVDTGTQNYPSQSQQYDDMVFNTAYTCGFTYLFSENFKIDLLAQTAGADNNIFEFNTWAVEFTYSY